LGKYRGFVADNQDPESRARLRLRVPSLFADEVTAWALPCLPFGGLAGQGLFSVPDIGAQVWVEFEGGDRMNPVWTGTFWQQQGDAPADAAQPTPTTRIFKTGKEHVLLFEDADNAEQVHLKHCAGAILDIDSQGTITLTDPNGATLTLDAANSKVMLQDANGNTLTLDNTGAKLEDANGNKIEMASSGVTVSGQQIVVNGSQVMLGGQGGEPIIKGQSFLTLFATHIHTCAAPGAPTSPPIPQGEMSSLSTKVMTS
jgi:phage baseplate assembly protein gpV